MKNDFNLIYNWQLDIFPRLYTLVDVSGGYTLARRGVVTLKDGARVFVKIATDENTKKWLKKEIKAYKKLLSAGYEFVPNLLACSDDGGSMAIEYLGNASFENTWNRDKLDAVIKAQESLAKLTKHFTNDSDFKSGDVLELDNKWSNILIQDNIRLINSKLKKLGAKDLQISKRQLQDYALLNSGGWRINEDTLIHEDIRADNFGYDPRLKIGKLIDWNWLCIGDKSLDTTPLFIDMLKGGFNPYRYHPEKYDHDMVAYLLSFWLNSILETDEDDSQNSWDISVHRVSNIRICVKLLSTHNNS